MSKTRRNFDWDDLEECEDREYSKTQKKPEKFKAPKDNRPFDREDYYRKDRYQDDDR